MASIRSKQNGCHHSSPWRLGESERLWHGTHTVFHDFENAFEIVIHLILLLKINELLPKWITTWIAEYQNNGQQIVKANKTVSEWIRVKAGVIQSRVLDPILFLIFISDINKYLPPSTNLTKFCDDLLTYERILNRLASRQLSASSKQHSKMGQNENKMRLNIKKQSTFTSTRRKANQPLLYTTNRSEK